MDNSGLTKEWKHYSQIDCSKTNTKEAALEYERLYMQALTKVKDKPSFEKIRFLLKETPEGMADSFKLFNVNFNTYLEPELLACVLVYRYEHNISILDDMDYEISLDEGYKLRSALYAEERRKIDEYYDDMKRNDPEKYQEFLRELEIDRIKQMEKEKEACEYLDKLNKTMTEEDYLRILASD